MSIKLLTFVALAVATANAQGGPWSQCGGVNWTSNTDCVSGYTCVKRNDWYYQCVPGASGLHGLISSKHDGRYFGNILDRNTINDATITGILNSEFGVITAENSMKWESIEPTRDQFNFANADSIVEWATSNRKLIRGHTLVWHSQLPAWVSEINDSKTLTQVIENHIKKLAGRYKGKIAHWDVVNEVILDDGNWRDSVFYRVLGEEFVDLALRTARKVDRKAKLYINDYNLDYSGPKVTAYIDLIARLKARRVPIDGIGTQAHLVSGRLGDVANVFQRLAATGLDLAITELDIRIPKPVDAAKLAQQQKDYETVTQACLSIPNCVGLSLWGVSDRDSWVDNVFTSDDSPLLWDDSINKKPAYTGVSNVLSA